MLSHYRLVEKIGEGGMGVVWKARDEKLDRTVALKILKSECVEDEHRHRFLREARAAATATHPFLASIHDAGEAGGTLFIVMEYVEGRTLRSLLERGPILIREALRYATEMAEGIASAHRLGLVHRDLKPDNVMVGTAGHVKILDFGLAKLVQKRDEAASLSLGESTTVTVEASIQGSIVGTPGYMSPEQARGEPVDSRTDIFSFGCTLYEMVTGRPPFRGRTRLDTLAEILHGEPVAPSALVAKIPQDLERIIHRCLRKRPEDRYNDTRDLVAALRDSEQAAAWAVDAPTGQSLRTSPPARRASLSLSLGVGVGALVLLVSAALTLRRPVRELLTHRNAASSGKPSMAVLFFQNLGPPGDDDFLAAALTEDVITSLARIDGLAVLSRSVMQRYRGTDTDPKQIGKELAANYILEGSIRKQARDLRVTAQLIETASGAHAWAERFDGSVEDLLAIQDTIAVRVAGALGIALRPEQMPLVAQRWTRNAEAYAYFLTGRERYFDMDSPQPKMEAQPWFEKALQLDPNYAPALCGLARVYATERQEGRDSPGRFEKAHALADRALALDSTLALAWESHGVAFGNEHRLEDSRAALERAIALNPDLREAYSALAWTYLELGETSKALDVAKRGIELEGPASLVHLRLADCYERLEGVSGAERILNEMMERFPGNPRIAAGLARLLRKAGRRGEAIELLRRLLDEHPGYYSGYVDQGVLLGELDRMAESDSIFRWTLDRWPDSPLVLGQAGWHFMQRGDYETAKADFERAIRLEPYQFTAWNNLGWCEFQAGKFTEAERIHQQRMERWPEDPHPSGDLAWVYERQERFRDAERVFLQRADRWPKDLDVLLDLAKFYNRRTRGETAQKWARKAIAVAPRSAGAYSRLGAAAWHQGDYELAAESYQKAIALDPDGFDGYNGLRNTLDRTGQLEKATEVIEGWVKRQPGHVDGWLSLGYQLDRQNKMHRSAAAWEQALELDPKNMRAINSLAVISARMHRYENAIDMFQRAAALDTTDALPLLNATDLAFNILQDDSLAQTTALRAARISKNGTWRSAWGHLLLAQIAQRSGAAVASSRHLATACAEIAEAQRDAPRSIQVARMAAVIYGASGELEKARKCAERVIEEQGKDPHALVDLAVAMAYAGDADGALEYLKLAVSVGYDDKEHLMRTRELARVRADPRFQNIVEMIR